MHSIRSEANPTGREFAADCTDEMLGHSESIKRIWIEHSNVELLFAFDAKTFAVALVRRDNGNIPQIQFSPALLVHRTPTIQRFWKHIKKQDWGSNTAQED